MPLLCEQGSPFGARKYPSPVSKNPNKHIYNHIPVASVKMEHNKKAVYTIPPVVVSSSNSVVGAGIVVVAASVVVVVLVLVVATSFSKYQNMFITFG